MYPHVRKSVIMARSKWKSPFVNIDVVSKLKKNNLSKNIYTNARSSTILSNFVGWNFYVHNGKEYIKILIASNMVGCKLGEFVFTRRVGNIHTGKKKK